MKRIIIPIILLIMLATEGVAMELLPSSIKFAPLYMTPHWLLLFLLIVVTFTNTDESFLPIVYAAIFGLMTDIVYTGVLGVYMFMLAIAVYVGQLLNRLLQTNLLMILITAIICLIIMELGLFSIYTLLNVVASPFEDFLTLRLAPTLLANLLFIIIIYYPSNKLLRWVYDGENN